MSEIKTEENIIQRDFVEEMKTAYRDYSMSVIIARALPDVRDGLKPVQRRVLYAMEELGLYPDRAHRKCARIVGDTMGKYHPHGDSSIYEALVHMSEDYSMNLPLVDGHGNFGSIDGDSAAAMRYTEAKLSEGAMTLLKHLEDGLVEFDPNFDESETEPRVLPAMLPNLLINGTTGIAVGMATNIPPHNAGEVINGTIAYMDNPDITTDELMQYIPGPDFPTGGIITNGSDIKALYETGEGKIRVRARVEIEKGDSGRKNIVISEIPYTSSGSKTRMVEGLVNLMRDKTFEEIYDVRDESSKEGIRIVIEVKRDRDAQNLLNGLYKKSSLEDTYGACFLAVKDQQPYQFSLKRLLEEFVLFQEEIYTREYQFRLEKNRKRLEVVDGLIKAVDVIDAIIEVLRGSETIKQAKNCLMTGDTTDINFKTQKAKAQAMTFEFTERQADAILAMQLRKLVGLELKQLTDEQEELAKAIKECEKVLGSKKELHKVIKKQLLEFKEKFSAARKTLIMDSEIKEYVVEEKIEELMVLVDRFGYVKTVDSAACQKAGDEALAEFVHVFPVRSDERVAVFSAEGGMYQVKVAQIPKARIKEKGTLIQNITKLGSEFPVLVMSYEAMFNSQLLFVTEGGLVKQVSGVEFDSNRAAIIATKLNDKDKVMAVIPLTEEQVLSGDTRVSLLTKKKVALQFLLSEIPEQKKGGKGVKGIGLSKDDKVAFAVVHDIKQQSATFEEKQFNLKKIRLRKRGLMGTKATLE
ncbi:MAG: DNA topoisomerase 4 subunit A [Lachnospiraceae bacterium]|nr:DNA topoisomerase 4 subunit A [Lachnospiraceae bacterium]